MSCRTTMENLAHEIYLEKQQEKRDKENEELINFWLGTFGEVYWLEGSYSYFTTIIKPNTMYKHLNTKDWDEHTDLVSNYIEGEYNKGFTYKTLDKAKLNAKSNEIYETLRNKENH